MVLDGPHAALLVHGDDRLGALAEIHERLHGVTINVFASTGVTHEWVELPSSSRTLSVTG